MSNLRALLLLPFAALADTLTAIADHIDTRYADALNTEADNT